MRGFTLLEMLLSIAIIAILAGLSVPIYQSFEARNDLDIATVTAVQSLRRAQVLSEAVLNDSSWGVHIATSSVTIFKGASFTGRDSSYDEQISSAQSVAYSGLSDVVFSKLLGMPSATGTIMATSTTNETRTININAKGAISY